MSKLFVSTGLAAALSLAVASAAQIPLDQARKLCHPNVSVGDLTPYGETPEEANNKLITFKWNCQAFVDNDPDGAFANYVSPVFCDHSHLVTRGKRACGSYAETLPNFERMAKMGASSGSFEFPTGATVDGEMVTMYGAGVDIFRVHDGKITDHWDASPPDTTTIQAHPPGTAQRVMSGEGPGPRKQ